MFTLLSRTIVGLCLAVMLTAPVAALADDAPVKDPEPTPQLDVGDVWRLLRHKDEPAADPGEKFVFVAPSVGSMPSTGLNAGIVTTVAFFLGDPATTRISSLAGALKLSQKKQTLGNVRFATFSNNDQWFFQGDNRLSWTSLDTYALGGASQTADAENVKFNLFRFYGTAYRSVKRSLFVGVGLNVSHHTNVRPSTSEPQLADDSAYGIYNRTHGFASGQQTSGGASGGLIFDTRDNSINAQRGVLASASYRTFFAGFLGGDSTWQELYLDGRAYKKLTKDGRHRLAFWFLGDLVTGGTAPFLDLPATATQERSARGYGEGRYRGEHLVYGEVEYRADLTSSGLLGMVAFLNTTTVDNPETGQRLFESFAPGAGFGLRVLLNKRSRTNLCTDYGWGKDGSRGFYLAIQEAF